MVYTVHSLLGLWVMISATSKKLELHAELLCGKQAHTGNSNTHHSSNNIIPDCGKNFNVTIGFNKHFLTLFNGTR